MCLFKKFNFIIVLILFFTFGCKSNKQSSVISENSAQIILVITDSLSANKGYLYAFEKDPANNWKSFLDSVKVVLGAKGLGLGKGLHIPSDLKGFPKKIEGDGRSPAGIFSLSSIFGYFPKEEMVNLKMPYTQITESVECVDDTSSKFYNQIMKKDTLLNKMDIDWKSSEKMHNAGIYYELGVIVNHNCTSDKSNSGSCIFLHNWADSNETTAGCTAMKPSDMKKIAFWLGENKEPILVQLTKREYLEKTKTWNLPLVGNFVSKDE